MSFVHLHSSGRFDRTPASLKAAAEKYQRHADLITYTEVQLSARRAALSEANGTQFVSAFGIHGNHNDTVVSWNKDKFTRVHSENYKASDVTYKRHNGKSTKPIYINIVVLEEKATAERFVIGVIHLASSVQGDLAHKRNTLRTISWFKTFRGSKARVNAVKKRYRAASAFYVADFNIDFKHVWARALVKSIAPLYNITWKNTNISGGTHGRRIIDATLARGKVRTHGAELFLDDDSSDHRPYTETLRLG